MPGIFARIPIYGDDTFYFSMAADHISQWRTRQSGVHHEKLQLREVTVDHQPCSESAVRLPQQQAGHRGIRYVTMIVYATIVCTKTHYFNSGWAAAAYWWETLYVPGFVCIPSHLWTQHFVLYLDSCTSVSRWHAGSGPAPHRFQSASHSELSLDAP